MKDLATVGAGFFIFCVYVSIYLSICLSATSPWIFSLLSRVVSFSPISNSLLFTGRETCFSGPSNSGTTHIKNPRKRLSWVLFGSHAHPDQSLWFGRQRSCALPWRTVPWLMDPGEGEECSPKCWVKSVHTLPGVPGSQPGATCGHEAVRASFSVGESKLWKWPLSCPTVTSLGLSFFICTMSMLGYMHLQRSLPNMTFWYFWDVYLHLKSCSLDLDNGNV